MSALSTLKYVENKLLYLENMKIGLFIQGGHLLSNGITQQGHYTKKTLEACGYTVDLLSTCPIETYVNLGHEVKIITKDMHMGEYSIIIFVSALLTSDNDDNKKFLENAKICGCKFVNLICGNIFYLYQEEIIFDVHNVISSNYNTYIDEIWVLPMYEHTMQLLEGFFKKPVKIAPYVWNADILKSFIQIDRIKYENTVPNNKVTTFSAEPNMSVHKNAFVPLLISECYQEKFNKLNSCVILCGTKLKLKSLEKYLDCKDKIQIYDRIAFYEVLRQAKENNISFPSIVSHQYLNDLNFVHFETLYCGWPLVHNCDRLMNVGYYYESHNVKNASTLLEYARLNHAQNHENYMKQVHAFLDEYSPCNHNVIEKYKSLIKNVLCT